LSEPRKKPRDAEEIFSEFQKTKEPKPTESEIEIEEPIVDEVTESEESVAAPEEIVAEEKEPPQPKQVVEEPQTRERNVIFVGVKPIMTYVTATLTQLSTQPTVTIKARGKRITQAVDVSQMIVKRLDAVGYKIGAVRIASDQLTSQDGRQRNVSAIEIDITKN
jgi:DNA-binding protein